MHSWLDFWFIFFWLVVASFIFNYSSILFFFFYSELAWLVLYCLTTNIAIATDDLNVLGLTFFLLGLAGLEFSVGFLILILSKYFKVSLNIFENQKSFNFFQKNIKNSTAIDNYFWLK